MQEGGNIGKLGIVGKNQNRNVVFIKGMNQNNEDRGIDLSHALDDSSSRVTFEGEEFQRPVQSFQTQTPKIIQWVIKYSGGAIKDEKQADYVLIGFVALAVIVASTFMFSGGGEKVKYSPRVQEEMQKATKNLFNY